MPRIVCVITFDKPVSDVSFSSDFVFVLIGDFVLSVQTECSTTLEFDANWGERGPTGAVVSFISLTRPGHCQYPFFDQELITTTTTSITTTTTTTTSFSEPVTTTDSCPILFYNDVEVKMLPDGVFIAAPSSAVDLILTFDDEINELAISTDLDFVSVSDRVLHLKNIDVGGTKLTVNWGEEVVFPVVGFAKRSIPEDCEIFSPPTTTTTTTTTTSVQTTTTTDSGVDSADCPIINYDNSRFAIIENGFAIQVPSNAVEVFVTFDKPIANVQFSSSYDFTQIGDFVIAINVLENNGTTISFDTNWDGDGPIGGVVGYLTISRGDSCRYPFFGTEVETTTSSTTITTTPTSPTTTTTITTTTTSTITSTTITTTPTTSTTTTTTTTTTTSMVFEGCHHVQNIHSVSGSVHLSEWLSKTGKFKFHRDVLLPKNSPPAGWYLHFFFSKGVSGIKIWDFNADKIRKTKSKEWKLVPNDDSVLDGNSGDDPYAFNFIGTSKISHGIDLTIHICYT